MDANAVATTTFTPVPATSTPEFDIAIVNASTVLSDAEVQAAIPAFQTQVVRDFLPVWGQTAKLYFFPKNAPIPDNYWVMVILDDSDQAGALGYHFMTAAGQPMSKVFVKTLLAYKCRWTVTFSHELLEMLLDPWANLTVFVQNSATSGRLYAYEVADACQGEQFAYEIDGTWVTDFVYPPWFFPQIPPNSTKFDHMGMITAPFQLLPGGYIGYFDIGPNSKGWQQMFMRNMAPEGTEGVVPEGEKMHIRFEKRELLANDWKPSTAI